MRQSPHKIVYLLQYSLAPRALNSAVECHLHTVEVAGSNPAAPTNSFLGLAGRASRESNPQLNPRDSEAAVGFVKISGLKVTPQRFFTYRFPRRNTITMLLFFPIIPLQCASNSGTSLLY
jgi:hypothetical protein